MQRNVKSKVNRREKEKDARTRAQALITRRQLCTETYRYTEHQQNLGVRNTNKNNRRTTNIKHESEVVRKQ